MMKKAKPSGRKTKPPQKMTKEELIATLVKKKQCNAKALSVVEGLLESRISEQWLLNSLQFIGQSHYQDAIEERAILKICGYPLCSNPLTNIPKQQYRISTQNNKVYDISERKHFCSNMCYRSSSFLKDQILTSPLWLRDIEAVPKFKLLDGGKTRGGLGDEIDVGPRRVTSEEASLTSVPPEHDACKGEVKGHDLEAAVQPGSDRTEEHPLNISSSDIDGSEIAKMTESENITPGNVIEEKQTNHPEISAAECIPLGKSVQNEQENVPEQTVTCDVQSNNEPNSRSVISSAALDFNKLKIEDSTTENIAQDDTGSQMPPTHAVIKKNVDNQETNVKTKTDRSTSRAERTVDNKNRTRRLKHSSTHPNVPMVSLPSVSDFVEQRLTEWFTLDSVCYLYGEQRTREMLGQQSAEFDQNFKPLASATWDPEKHERFVKICKRLNLLDIEDKSFDEKVINDERNIVKRPLPDFGKLKEEAEKMDLRVRAFYKGQLELQPRSVTFAEDVKEGAEEELPVLPLVHQHEQRAVRRRLVLDALNRVLPDLLRTLGVNSSLVTSALRGLIGTFALTAVNITLNPRQWTLIAIVVIKLLAIREARLNMVLASEASQKYLTLIQMSFSIGPTYLDQLIDRLVSSALFSQPAKSEPST